MVERESHVPGVVSCRERESHVPGVVSVGESVSRTRVREW